MTLYEGRIAEPTGIIEVDFDLSPEIAEHLVSVWRAAGNRPVVFGKGVHYRARLADGSFEPRQTDLTTIEASRDWLPYLIALSGWIVAALAVVVR